MGTQKERKLIEVLRDFKESSHYEGYKKVFPLKPILAPYTVTDPPLTDFTDIFKNLAYGTAFLNSHASKSLIVPDSKSALESLLVSINEDVIALVTVKNKLLKKSKTVFIYELLAITHFQLDLFTKSLDMYFDFTNQGKNLGKSVKFMNENSSVGYPFDFLSYADILVDKFSRLGVSEGMPFYDYVEVHYNTLLTHLEGITEDLKQFKVDTPIPLIDLVQLSNEFLIVMESHFLIPNLLEMLTTNLNLQEPSNTITGFTGISRLSSESTVDSVLDSLFDLLSLYDFDYDFDDMEMKDIPVFTLAILNYVLGEVYFHFSDLSLDTVPLDSLNVIGLASLDTIIFDKHDNEEEN